jgi:AbrB family looped-hinge helix DNA binding protein
MADEEIGEVEYLTTTRLGEKGQLTIPKEYRDSMDLDAGSPMAIIRVGPGLMLFPEQARFKELCDRLTGLLSDSDLPEPGILGGIAAIIANQEKIIANQMMIISNQ